MRARRHLMRDGGRQPIAIGGEDDSYLDGVNGLTVWLRGDFDVDNDLGFIWGNGGSAADFSEAVNKPEMSTIDGRAAVHFVGANEDFLVGSILSTLISSTIFWVGIVFLADTAPIAGGGPASDPPLLADVASYWAINHHSTGVYVYAWTGTTRKTVPLATPVGTAFFVEAWMTAGSLYCKVASNEAVAIGGTVSSLTSPCHLARRGASTKVFDGKIGEVIVLNQMPTGDQITTIRTAMTARWGVTTS